MARVSAGTSADSLKRLDLAGVKVFSATMHRDRDQLGERITEWLQSNPGHEIVDKIVTQSSDSAFHCLTITLFYGIRSES